VFNRERGMERETDRHITIFFVRWQCIKLSWVCNYRMQVTKDNCEIIVFSKVYKSMA